MADPPPVLDLSNTPLGIPPGIADPDEPRATTPEEMTPKNPVPAGFNPFDRRRLDVPNPNPSPIENPMAHPNAGEPVVPPTEKPPPLGPGSSLSTTKDPNSDFNLFIKQMMDYAGPPGSLDPANALNQSRKLQEQADREEQTLDTKITESQALVNEHAKAEMAQLKPLFAAQDIRVKKAMDEVEEAQKELPKYTPPPAIDPKSAEAYAMAVFALGLIGGAVGKGGWMRVASYFNGTLNGLVEGDIERTERYRKAWQQEYESSMGKLKARQETMRDIVYATDIPINRILKEAEIQAKIDGLDQHYILAQQGHIDKLRRLSLDEEKAAMTAEFRNAQIKAQIDGAIMRLHSGRAGMAAGNNLDDYGKWALAKITAGGNLGVLTAMTTRWASPQRAEVWNAIAKEWYDQGVDPTTFTENQIGIQVEKGMQKWAKNRYAAMGRLERSLQLLKEPMADAVVEANGLNPHAFNSPVNELLREFGSGVRTASVSKVSALAYTVGREYNALATMPVSNAQMHWGSQQIADKMVNGNMSLAELSGFYGSVVIEIRTNRQALKEQVEVSMQDVESMGISVRPEDFGLPAKKEMTEDEANAKYGPSPTPAPSPAPAR